MKDARVLYLPLKAVYFHAIKTGEKLHEYRLDTPYWRKRLENREYDEIEFTKGYPPKFDRERRFRRAWKGCWKKIHKHPHFGDKPVKVFVIPVNP